MSNSCRILADCFPNCKNLAIKEADEIMTVELAGFSGALALC